MLMRFIKYSLYCGILLFSSCDILADNILENMDDDHEKSYSCHQQVVINSFQKIPSNCKYTVNYNNSNVSQNGRFLLTYKTATRTYSLYSDVVELQNGSNDITFTINQCNFEDNVVNVCYTVFM